MDGYSVDGFVSVCFRFSYARARCMTIEVPVFCGGRSVSRLVIPAVSISSVLHSLPHLSEFVLVTIA